MCSWVLLLQSFFFLPLNELFLLLNSSSTDCTVDLFIFISQRAFTPSAEVSIKNGCGYGFRWGTATSAPSVCPPQGVIEEEGGGKSFLSWDTLNRLKIYDWLSVMTQTCLHCKFSWKLIAFGGGQLVKFFIWVSIWAFFTLKEYSVKFKLTANHFKSDINQVCPLVFKVNRHWGEISWLQVSRKKIILYIFPFSSGLMPCLLFVFKVSCSHTRASFTG